MQRLVKGITTTTRFADVEIIGGYLTLIPRLHIVVQAHGAVLDFRQLREAVTIGIVGRTHALKAIYGESLLAVLGGQGGIELDGMIRFCMMAHAYHGGL